MKIISWNVNSVRARIVNILHYIKDSNPDILFLDEPLAGIDYKSMIDIFQILKNQKANGKTIVIVHHNIEDLSKYFDNVVVVNKKIIDFGSTKDVLKRGSISKAFNN